MSFHIHIFLLYEHLTKIIYIHLLNINNTYTESIREFASNVSTLHFTAIHVALTHSNIYWMWANGIQRITLYQYSILFSLFVTDKFFLSAIMYGKCEIVSIENIKKTKKTEFLMCVEQCWEKKLFVFSNQRVKMKHLPRFLFLKINENERTNSENVWEREKKKMLSPLSFLSRFLLVLYHSLFALIHLHIVCSKLALNDNNDGAQINMNLRIKKCFFLLTV